MADVIKEIAPLIKSSIAEALDKHVPATSLDREDVTSDLPVLQNMFGDATMTKKVRRTRSTYTCHQQQLRK